ncbi:hypothetical protein D621_19580 [beta proteobacterium AAP51]|nr:hypothetical protein D621_19580 [beta proteobacterium AAP51]
MAGPWAWRRWWAQRLSSRIVALFLGLLLVVQLASWAVVNASIERNARGLLAEELGVGEKIWARLLAQRAARLTMGASVLAADYGFRSAVALGDTDTLQSALANHGQRIGANVTAMLASDLTLRALGEDTEAGAFEALQPLAQQLAAEGSALVLVGGQPYQVVMVPMRAPLLVGYVVMGFAIDQALLDDMRGVSGLHTAVLLQSPDGRREALLSTLGGPLTAELAQGWAGPAATATGTGPDGSKRQELQLAGQAHLLRPIPQTTGPAGALHTLLLRSVADAVAPYRPLQRTLLGLTLLGLLMAGAASVFTARRITTPLRGLMHASEALGRGDFEPALAHTGREDEIGQLARSFDQMRRDIAASEAEIRELAYHDRLTGLPNRVSFSDALRSAIDAAHSSERPFSVVVLGLDRFKRINENRGYAVGDDVLREVAARLRRQVPAAGLLARLSGDQFGLLLPGTAQAPATALVDALSASFVQPIGVRGEQVDAPVTFGMACWPAHAPALSTGAGAERDQAEALMARAERALDVAKRRKAAHLMVYEPGIDAASEQTLTLLSELRQAVGNHELRMFLQPKIDLASHRLVGAEALVRWQHPTRGMVPPLQFIPFAEENGFVRQLTLWIFEEAARQWPALQAEGLHRLSVNLSTRDLLDAELPARFAALLRRHGVPATAFCLEITESAVMNEPERALAMLHTLAQAGFQLSIDDFGEGATSLKYLQELPVHELKIDQIFIKQLDRREKDAIIVRNTIRLAHDLGFRAVAEGVENAHILGALRTLGCDEAQGYHLGRPMPAAELPAFARRWAAQDVPQAATAAAETPA